MKELRHVDSVKSRISEFWRMNGKRGNFRILYSSAAMMLGLILILILLNVLNVHRIELVVNGKSITVETKVHQVEELLAEQGITIGEHDSISVPLTDNVRDHTLIEVKHAVPITVLVDGQEKEIMTTADTVDEVLKQTEINLGELDRVEPSLQESISSGEEIRIARIEKRVETETEIVPYDIVERRDPTLVKGKEQVVQEGRVGMLEQTFERIYEDGRLIEETLIASEQTRETMEQIVAVGTKSEVAILSAASPNVQTVTKDGVTFGVKRVIEATLTAYHAGLESTGKTEGHPLYGITYTGTTVEEGRTVAVDPDVIPFGWWIYIEEYGFRRAEDKGSGVQGNWVDIYYDSLEAAESFGKQKGTVYIIGPDHPLAE